MCQGQLFLLYTKTGVDNRPYDIYRCKDCNLWQLVPLPSSEYLDSLYQGQYFQKRSDRGYSNYASDQVRKSIEDTFYRNLKDLSFFEWENQNSGRLSLDVGCAGGYFVEYLKNRGWQAEGVDVSLPMIEFARGRGLDVQQVDFLSTEFKEEHYDLITLWATIEHLREPVQFVGKIYRLLKKGGRCIISTCHTGFWARVYGIHWRFLNVPEHLWYFNRKNLITLFAKSQFQYVKSFTYGSGHTSKAGKFFALRKRIADLSAKWYHSGDMIVIQFEK